MAYTNSQTSESTRAVSKRTLSLRRLIRPFRKHASAESETRQMKWTPPTPPRARSAAPVSPLARAGRGRGMIRFAEMKAEETVEKPTLRFHGGWAEFVDVEGF